LFERYFAVFPWTTLPPRAVGFDAGCGSGRWARLVAPRVGFLHCIDASNAALTVAAHNLSGNNNCALHLAMLDDIPLPDESMDFGYSLGVLHHIPDTYAALCACVRKLKPGAPFLLYLYYRFENRPRWFRMIWRASTGVRLVVSRMPFALRALVCDTLATAVYWPLARAAALAEKLGAPVNYLPLSSYRNRSFYVMRTDALDRFGTRLEKRFTRQEIRALMGNAGLSDVVFHEGEPYWVAVGRRAPAI
jgi:ubiquinone/menaquinone biosynthesis C-methylase UbiE